MAAYHVLVVDDNHEIRRMVTASIKTLGADIDVLDVPSAEEALFISTSLPLDLIVLDFRLPGMSGLEMVDRLRKRKPGIKIILVTGVEDEASRQQITRADVAAYFFKPINITTFLETVRRVLGLGEAMEQGTSYGPGAGREPFAHRTPVEKEIAVDIKRSAGQGGAPTPANTIKNRFTPRVDERLNALKQQLRAQVVLLVDEKGLVIEVAGNPSLITADSMLMPALIASSQASQKAAEVLGRDTSECLVHFANGKQHIYLSPVNPSMALLAAILGYFEPEKIGLIERAIHLAVRDIQSILEQAREAESQKLAEADAMPADLPADITVDPDTLKAVAKIFSAAPKKGGKEKAEGFWEDLEENGALDGRGGKGVISYEEAQKLGLTPGEAETP